MRRNLAADGGREGAGAESEGMSGTAGGTGDSQRGKEFSGRLQWGEAGRVVVEVEKTAGTRLKKAHLSDFTPRGRAGSEAQVFLVTAELRLRGSEGVGACKRPSCSCPW